MLWTTGFIKSYGAALEYICNSRKNSSVYCIKSYIIYIQCLKAVVRYFLIDNVFL